MELLDGFLTITSLFLANESFSRSMEAEELAAKLAYLVVGFMFVAFFFIAVAKMLGLF